MNWSGKKVLVTGGAGFLGYHLSDKLLDLGADVSIIDLPGKKENIYNPNVGIYSRCYGFYEVDIADLDALNSLKLKPNYIFHLAALAVPGDCEKNPELAYKRNTQGTFNVLEYARKTKDSLEKVVFTSTAQLYGTYPKYFPIDENHPVDTANSFYNYTKKLGEEHCQFFLEKHGLPVSYLRLFNAFGERQAADYFLPTVIIKGLKGKIDLWNENPTRDFTYVKDTVKALILAAESRASGGPINIGSGKEISIGELARQIAKSFGLEPIFENKPVTGSMRMQCNNAKAKNVLGWQPEISFEEGLERTIGWYKENKHLYLS